MTKIIPAFCSNLLPQESLKDLFPALLDFSTEVQFRAGLKYIGIDLRLGLEGIANGQNLDLVKQWRDRFAAQHIVFTSLNIFPLRPFQDKVVKDKAYDPDWGSQQRLQASIDAIAIADLLCDPQQNECSLSTIPGSYLPWGQRAADNQTMAINLGKWVSQAWLHRATGGRRMILCIEPEPLCSWGNTPSMLSFWEAFKSTIRASAQQGIGTDAEQAVNEHIACCWDTCHASVLFEDQERSIGELSQHGLRPMKVQYSAAPKCLTNGRLDGIEALCAMHEPRFCHQVGVQHHNGTVEVLEDLPDLSACLPAWRKDPTLIPKQVCTHFHIPVNSPPTSALLSSSVAESDLGLKAALDYGAKHISVETYTWSLRQQSGDDMAAGTTAEVRHLANKLEALGVLR